VTSFRTSPPPSSTSSTAGFYTPVGVTSFRTTEQSGVRGPAARFLYASRRDVIRDRRRRHHAGRWNLVSIRQSA